MQPPHQVHEWPKRATARAVETGTIPSQRQVLARERGPGQISETGQLRWLHRSNILNDQLLATPVRGISRALHVIEVVGEDTRPLHAKTGMRHPTASKELIERFFHF
jgi:hypothetical protein